MAFSDPGGRLFDGLAVKADVCSYKTRQRPFRQPLEILAVLTSEDEAVIKVEVNADVNLSLKN